MGNLLPYVTTPIFSSWLLTTVFKPTIYVWIMDLSLTNVMKLEAAKKQGRAGLGGLRSSKYVSFRPIFAFFSGLFLKC